MAEYESTMLGPGRPEIGCDECFHLLDRYVERDHERGDARDAFPELAAHLDGCPVCHEEYESLLGLLDDVARR